MWLIRRRWHQPARRPAHGVCRCVRAHLAQRFHPLARQGTGLLLATLLVIGAGALALFPCYYSFVQELSDRHVGRLTGLLSMWVWAVTSPMHSAFGKLADSAADPAKRYDLGLVIAGLAPWIGVVAMKFLWRDPERAPRGRGE